MKQYESFKEAYLIKLGSREKRKKVRDEIIKRLNWGTAETFRNKMNGNYRGNNVYHLSDHERKVIKDVFQKHGIPRESVLKTYTI